MDDELLVEASRRGDNDAFYALIAKHRDRMYRMAYSYLKDENDALDAIQEVTCRAYMQIRKLKEPRYFGTWLIRILMNHCADELNKRNRRNSVQYRAGTDLEGSIPTGESSLLERVLIESAVEQLEEHHREVIQLKYYHDLTITEIARTLEKPEGTIRTWLHKALTGLRQRLGKDGETL